MNATISVTIPKKVTYPTRKPVIFTMINIEKTMVQILMIRLTPFKSGCRDKFMELLIKLTSANAILDAPNITQTISISIFIAMSETPRPAKTNANINLCRLKCLIANFIVK